MLKKRNFIGTVCATAAVSMLYVLYCTLPSDPNDPSNTSVTPILRASDWTQNSSSISDTVGNTVQIGVMIRLPQYVDSIKMSITADGAPVFDTVFRSFRTESTDTVWKKIYFTRPGTKTVSITPYSTKAMLDPSIAVINIFDRPDQQNVKPELFVPATVVIQPVAVCSIRVRVIDSDLDQSHTVTMPYFPAGATVQDDTLFLWSVPADFSGIDSVTFIATDNGTSPLSDTATTILSLTATISHYPVIKVNGNRSIHPLETCSLTIVTSDEDAGQIVTVSMTGNPDGARLIGSSAFVWTAPAEASGNYQATFTAQDNGTPPLSDSETVTIEVIPAGVNRAPVWRTDTLPVSIADDGSYALTLADSCSDPDGDAAVYVLLDGSPAGDAVVDGRYSVTADAAMVGTHLVRLVATDPGNLSDTLVVKLTVGYSPATGATIAALNLSAGTLTQLTGMVVPDTIRDTVSYTDSTITVSLTARDAQATITVNGSAVAAGTSSGPHLLAVGGTTFTITVTSGTVSKTYVLLVVRKPDSTIPLTTPPAGVTATAVSAFAIRITWDDLFGANSYTIQKSVTGTDGSFTTAGTATGTSFTDTGLTAGTTCHYRVNASNSNNSTDYSEPVSATTWTKISISGQPKDTALAIGGSLTLRVVAAGTDMKYVWRRDGVALPDTAATLTISALGIAHAGTYTVKVWNASDSVVTTPFRVRVLPQKPANVAATVSSGYSVEVTWDTANGATSYKVIRSSNNGSYTTAGTPAQASLVDTPLTEGTVYSYRVLAVNSDGASDTSAPATATTLNGPQIATTLQPLTVAVGQAITLTIAAATGSPIITYQWHKNGQPMDGQTSTTMSIASAQLSDSGMYKVVATNSVKSVSSNEVKVTVLPTYTLTVNKTATGGTVGLSKDTAVYVSGTQVTLTATPASGYRFDGWTGDTTAAKEVNPLTVTMKKNRTITAKWVRQFTLTLTTSDAAKGAVSSTMGSSPLKVDSGTVVPIAATPVGSFKFKQWSVTSGQASVAAPTSASTSVTMAQGNATVQGGFGCVTFAKQLSLQQYPNADFMDAVQSDDGGYLVINNDGLLIKLNSQGDTTWTKGTYASGARTIYKTNNSYVFPSTDYNQTSGNYYAQMYCYANNGNYLWTFYSNLDYSMGQIAMPVKDGGFILGGDSASQYFIEKTDENHNLVWYKRYDIIAGNFKDCRPTRDGGYIIVGTSDQGFGGTAIKINNVGGVEWQDDFRNTVFAQYGQYSFFSVDTLSDGKFVVAGRADLNRGFYLKLGVDKSVDGFLEYADAIEIQNIKVTRSGELFMVGSTITLGVGGKDIYILKTGANGSVLNHYEVGTTSDDYGRALKVTSDGGAIIVGTGNWIIKTDENGNVD